MTFKVQTQQAPLYFSMQNKARSFSSAQQSINKKEQETNLIYQIPESPNPNLPLGLNRKSEKPKFFWLIKLPKKMWRN